MPHLFKVQLNSVYFMKFQAFLAYGHNSCSFKFYPILQYETSLCFLFLKSIPPTNEWAFLINTTLSRACELVVSIETTHSLVNI